MESDRTEATNTFSLICFRSCSCGEVTQLYLTLCKPMDTRLLCPWDFLGKSTGMGCHFLLQGIYPTQGLNLGLPGGAEVKVSAWNAGDQGSIPGSGRSPGKGNGTPLQYFCLENPMDWGASCTTVHGVTKSQTRLSS